MQSPTKVDKIMVLKSGRKIAVNEYGDKNGKPLFFFHGWPSSRLRAPAFDKAAKKIRVRLICPDRPGYGLSDYQENRTLLDWSDDVIEIADQLKLKKFAVVGVSGGGPYAAVCAYKIPERLNNVGIVVGLVPTNIPGILDGMPFTYKFGWQHYQNPIVAWLGAEYCNIQAKYLPVLEVFQRKTKTDKLLLEEYKDEYRASNREAFRQGIAGPMLDLKLYSKDWGFSLSDIKSKVYLWYGEADKNVTLAMGKYYASEIKGSKLKVFPEEGHMISLTHANEIFRTLVS